MAFGLTGSFQFTLRTLATLPLPPVCTSVNLLIAKIVNNERDKSSLILHD